MIDPWPLGVAALPFTFVLLTWLAAALARSGLIGLPDERRRIGCLDGLRGYLAIGVACHHSLIWMSFETTGVWTRPSSALFTNLGEAGVCLFFMVTGALFYDIAFRTPSRRGWAGLYVGRVFRLLPLLFVVAVVAHLGLVVAESFTPSASPGRLLSSVFAWTFLGKISHLGPHTEAMRNIASVRWSLKYEVVFYALLPVLAAASAAFARFTPNRRLFLASLLLLSFLARGTTVAGYQLAYGMLFVLGAVALELREGRWRPWLQGRIAALVGAAALGAELTLFPTSYAVVPFLLLAAFFIPVVAGNSYFGVLATTGAIVLGELSYGIYLWHTAVIAIPVAGFGLLPPLAWVALPGVLAVVVLVSLASFRLVEQPGMAMGRQLRARLRRRDEGRKAGEAAPHSPGLSEGARSA